MDDKFHDECAVVGIIGAPDAANYCYLGLYAMQHRGHEGAGIVSTDGKNMFSHRNMGVVSEVFNENNLSELVGGAAIGHTRYATFGSKDWQNLQPLVANFSDQAFAIAHNGNLVNAAEIRRDLELHGALFATTSDTEVILHLLAREDLNLPLAQRLKSALARVVGAYSLAVLSLDRLIAVRDPSGVRPLSLGKIGNSYLVASETCAFDLVGAEFVRDIEPGEILEISSTGIVGSTKLDNKAPSAFCVFEYVYFSRPDSVIAGRNVYEARRQLGAELAKEHPAAADLIIPVPDSGVPAAIGYAQQSKLPLEFGLIRNHYVGRTFIEPAQAIRDFGVKVKLNASRSVLAGKRVVIVDDSVVRGTTCKKIVAMVRRAGAKEVHFRVSSPPTVGPCHYGIDTPSREELIAAHKSVEEIRIFMGADTLGYLSNEGMFRAVQGPREKYCDACFSNKYPLGEIAPAKNGHILKSIGQNGPNGGVGAKR